MIEAQIERATWLGRDLLLVVGRFGDGPEGGVDTVALGNGRRLGLEARTRYLEDPAAPADGAPKRVLIARFPDPEGRSELERIELGEGDAAVSVDLQRVQQATTDWETLLAEDLKEAEARFRFPVLGSMVRAAAPSLLEPGGFSLARKLGTIREQLRPHMPSSIAKPEEPQAVAVDAILAVDDQSFLIRGWAHDEDRAATRLTVVSPEGARAELLETAFRLVRPDIKEIYGGLDVALDKHGFIDFVELDTPSLLPDGWVIELVTSARGIENKGPQVARELDTVRNGILNQLKHEPLGNHELIENHVHPALDRLQNRLASQGKIDTVVELGTPPDSPTTSILVPLYEHVEFIECQIALLAQDPDARAADLVYVLDSPQLAEMLEEQVRQLYALYGVPLRLAVLNDNVGVANARNLAATLARGRLLLFYDSDVVPDRPGWLGRMSSFCAEGSDLGAVGAKLLYEDDSIQHAGVHFEWDSTSATWQNTHHFKGLNRHLEAAEVARPVPAVTGACLMIDRELFEQAGRFSHAYVLGGCEDSDLCLRLSEQGRQNWYVPDVELYHLEAQSFPMSRRRVMSARHNSWLQTRLWGDRIRALSDSLPAGG